MIDDTHSEKLLASIVDVMSLVAREQHDHPDLKSTGDLRGIYQDQNY